MSDAPPIAIVFSKSFTQETAEEWVQDYELTNYDVTQTADDKFMCRQQEYSGATVEKSLDGVEGVKFLVPLKKSLPMTTDDGPGKGEKGCDEDEGKKNSAGLALGTGGDATQDHNQMIISKVEGEEVAVDAAVPEGKPGERFLAQFRGHVEELVKMAEAELANIEKSEVEEAGASALEMLKGLHDSLAETHNGVYTESEPATKMSDAENVEDKMSDEEDVESKMSPEELAEHEKTKSLEKKALRDAFCGRVSVPKAFTVAAATAAELLADNPHAAKTVKALRGIQVKGLKPVAPAKTGMSELDLRTARRKFHADGNETMVAKCDQALKQLRTK